jgi:L-asparagine transporter-like permease
MSGRLLLPNRFKLIGWYIFIPATIMGIILSFTGFEASWLNAKTFAVFIDDLSGRDQMFRFIETNLTNTIVGVLFIIGAMMVGFSKEKREDEFIAKLRLSSLLWAVWVNYILLFLAFLFVYGTAFFTVMIYNMFTVLIIFIMRFNYILYKNSKPASDEK